MFGSEEKPGGELAASSGGAFTFELTGGLLSRNDLYCVPSGEVRLLGHVIYCYLCLAILFLREDSFWLIVLGV